MCDHCYDASVTLTREELEPKVLAGAALLDEKEPGWFRKINKGTLDISGPFTCLLGQLFDNYGAGLDHLDLLGRGKSDVHGFFISANRTPDGQPIDYLRSCKVLDELWIEQVDQKLAA